MAKGDGSIIKRGRNQWEIQVSFGKDPITGKYRRISRSVQGTKAQARRIRNEILKEQEQGISPDAGKVTLSEFAASWISNLKTTAKVSPAWAETKALNLRYVAEYLGSVPIKDITPLMIEETYNLIRETRGLGGISMLHLHRTLKQMFRKAVDYDLILRNPCDRVEAPRAEEPPRRSLSIEECARLFSCLDETEAEYIAELDAKEIRQTEWGNLFGRSAIRYLSWISDLEAVRIALATGMRRGEVLGLMWGDLSKNCDIIKVTHSLCVYDGKLKEPKTKAGHRTVHLDKETARHLYRWREIQWVELLKLGIKQDDTTPVCCSDVGGFIDGNNLHRWWRRFRTKNGFEGLKLHELRHTQATQLLANGVDIKTVQTRLGHASASITLNFYAHAIPENDEKAAEIFDKAIAQAMEPKQAKVIDVRTA